ncbi:MAG: hypothetical protein ACYCS8_18720 [Acidithiobacillus sp.]
MKLYIVMFAIVAALAALGGAFMAGRHSGVVSMTLRLQRAQEASQTRQDKLLTKLQEANQHERVITRTRIQVIRAAKAECLDQRMPASILAVLPRGVHHGQPQTTH